MSLLTIGIDAAILGVTIGNASRIAMLVGLYSAGRLAPQTGLLRPLVRKSRSHTPGSGSSAALVRERPAP